MIEKLPSFQYLMKQLQQIPGLSHRHIYKATEFFISLDPGRLEEFCTTLLYAQQQLNRCAICFCWYEKVDMCCFCSSAVRDAKIIGVVEQWVDVLTIEKTQGFKGMYHVLGGVINPLHGIGPNDLRIDNLVKRIEGSGVKEVLLALNATPEGDATVIYIASQLKHTGVMVSCLARGIPMGASLDFVDKITVQKALQERKQF